MSVVVVFVSVSIDRLPSFLSLSLSLHTLISHPRDLTSLQWLKHALKTVSSARDASEDEDDNGAPEEEELFKSNAASNAAAAARRRSCGCDASARASSPWRRASAKRTARGKGECCCGGAIGRERGEGRASEELDAWFNREKKKKTVAMENDSTLAIWTSSSPSSAFLFLLFLFVLSGAGFEPA